MAAFGLCCCVAFVISPFSPHQVTLTVLVTITKTGTFTTTNEQLIQKSFP